MKVAMPRNRVNADILCRGIPHGCVETGQDHGGLEPRNRERRKRSASCVHTNTVNQTERSRKEVVVGFRLNAVRENSNARTTQGKKKQRKATE